LKKKRKGVRGGVATACGGRGDYREGEGVRGEREREGGGGVMA